MAEARQRALRAATQRLFEQSQKPVDIPGGVRMTVPVKIGDQVEDVGVDVLGDFMKTAKGVKGKVSEMMGEVSKALEEEVAGLCRDWPKRLLMRRGWRLRR